MAAPEAVAFAERTPRLRTAGVLGLGAALPERSVSSGEVAALAGVDEAWVVRRTGIHERRRAAGGDTLVELATRAGRAALDDAAISADKLDLVIVATIGTGAVTPNVAPQVAHAVGAGLAGAFDVGAACTGFVTGLATAGTWIEAGRANVVLLVGAELMSRHLDLRDRGTAALFGDGAGAVVLAAGAPGSLGPVVLGSDGACAGLIDTDPASGLIRMDGHETFKRAVAAMGDAAEATCAAAGVGLADIDVFVFHQANARITAALRERLGLPAERVVDCIAQLGNTSAASVPLALEHARGLGLLRPGARVLMAAAGAGFTWGSALLEWGQA